MEIHGHAEMIAKLQVSGRVDDLLRNVSAATHEDMDMIARACGARLPPCATHTTPLTGEFLLTFSSAGDLLSELDAELAHYVEFLRLFSAVRFARLHKRLPSAELIALPDSVEAQDRKKLHEMRVTEQMMMDMAPLSTFGPALGIKNSVLKMIQEDVLRPKPGMRTCLLHHIQRGIGTSFLLAFE